MEYERKPIPGFPNYEVDTLGRVYSLKSKKWLSPLGKNLHPYLHVQLCKKGYIKNVLIHRLVAEIFIPNPENLTVVNHKDGNKYNNTVDNLEWVSPQGNAQHYEENLKVDPRTPKPIYSYSPNTGELIEEFDDYRKLNKDGRFKKYVCRIVKIANKEKESAGTMVGVITRKICCGRYWSWNLLTPAYALEEMNEEGERDYAPSPPLNPIFAYNPLTGEKVRKFNNQREVARFLNPGKITPPSTTRISSVLSEQYDAKTYRGFYLSYRDLTPEEVKEKLRAINPNNKYKKEQS